MSLYQRLQQWIPTLKQSIQVDSKGITWFYSRSRGPGGQHVNKVNTKAELHFSPAACPWVPEELTSAMSRVVRFKSDQFRSQQQNKEACLGALRGWLESEARALAQAPVSQEQLAKVESFRRAAKEAKKEHKMRHSQLKQERSSWRRTSSKD